MRSDESTMPKSFFANNLTLRQLSTKRIIGVLGGFALVSVAVAAVAYGTSGLSTADRSEPTARRLPVAVEAAQEIASYQASRSYTGQIVAGRESSLAFDRADRVVEVLVDQGHQVEAGQVLARLDQRTLSEQRRELVARRDQAAARLDEMISGPRIEKIDAALALKQMWAAELKQLELQHERRVRLRDDLTITQEELDDVTYSMRAAAARHDEARHAHRELVNGTRKEQIAAQRATVAQLNAAIARLDIDLADSTLVAPFAGRIASRLVDDGTFVAAGETIVRLVEDSVLEAWVGLPVQAASGVQPGTYVDLQVEGQPLPARVARLLPEVDARTRTRTVVLELDSVAVDRVVPGEVIRWPLAEEVEQAGFWLPLTSLVQADRGLWAVMVASPGEGQHQLVRREVEVLDTQTDRVLVRGTLRDGELVVLAGNHRAVPGQLVEPIMPNETDDLRTAQNR